MNVVTSTCCNAVCWVSMAGVQRDYEYDFTFSTVKTLRGKHTHHCNFQCQQIQLH